MRSQVVFGSGCLLRRLWGICGNEYFHATFPESINNKTGNIANEELFTILVPLKTLITQI